MIQQINYSSPAGHIVLAADDNHLTHIVWQTIETKLPNAKTAKGKLPVILKDTKQQLDEYFAGKRKIFDIPIKQTGTPFQQQVWQALCEIPYGETISYKQLASNINNTGAVRAVGSANGKNAISIIVPCHRVIASDGTLGGYAGGLNSKTRLLQLENSLI